MTPTPDDAAPQPIDPLDPKVLASLGLTPPGPRATGPKTAAGKARSRANAVKHGLRCQVVEPPDQREKIAERVAEWTDAMKPADAVQRWLVARAATASVRLDRCVERENLALEENTAAAERAFFRRRRAWARRTGQKLQADPRRAYALLTSSAFGCDWLIARFDDLAADLEMPGGYWSRAEFLRCLLLLGFDYDRIPPGQPVVARLYRDHLAADRAPNPDEVEAFLNLDTKTLEPADRAAAQRLALGDRESARRRLLAFVRDRARAPPRTSAQILWNDHDVPALEAACARCRTFDASPEAALARRYESANALELHRHLADFHRARRAGRRSRRRSARRTNVKMGKLATQLLTQQTHFRNPLRPSPASPGRSEGVGEASRGRSEGVRIGSEGGESLTDSPRTQKQAESQERREPPR